MGGAMPQTAANMVMCTELAEAPQGDGEGILVYCNRALYTAGPEADEGPPIAKISAAVTTTMPQHSEE